jgi:hypothetical protein
MQVAKGCILKNLGFSCDQAQNPLLHYSLLIIHSSLQKLSLHQIFGIHERSSDNFFHVAGKQGLPT